MIRYRLILVFSIFFLQLQFSYSQGNKQSDTDSLAYVLSPCRYKIFFDVNLLYPQSENIYQLNRGIYKSTSSTEFGISFTDRFFDTPVHYGLGFGWCQFMHENYEVDSDNTLVSDMNIYRISAILRHYIRFTYFLNFYAEISGGVNFFTTNLERKEDTGETTKVGKGGKKTVYDYTTYAEDNSEPFAYGIGIGLIYEFWHTDKAAMGLHFGCKYRTGKKYSLDTYDIIDADNFNINKINTNPDFLSFEIGFVVLLR